jgi:hypothetical protein
MQLEKYYLIFSYYSLTVWYKEFYLTFIFASYSKVKFQHIIIHETIFAKRNILIKLDIIIKNRDFNKIFKFVK